jgi:hypothetical protein
MSSSQSDEGAPSDGIVPVAFDTKAAIDFVAKVIEVEFGSHRSKAKAVSAHTAGEASPRTAQTWIRRQSAPSLAAFLNMLVGPRPVPAMRAHMRALLDMGDSDPRFQRALAELIQAATRRAP